MPLVSRFLASSFPFVHIFNPHIYIYIYSVARGCDAIDIAAVREISLKKSR